MANKYKLKFTMSDGNTIDAGEIVVPEGAKGDKGDKGDPYTLTNTDKAAIVQDVLAALPYYDGTVTISGGVELISFTIAGTSYQAENGMTWEQWCDSSYNTEGYIATSAGVYRSGPYYIRNGNNYVLDTDVIIDDNAYTEIMSGGGA